MGLSGAVLAIDAGNSKTDVAVVTADGEVAGTARGGGFRPPATGVEAAVDTLAEAVARAQDAAGHLPVAQVSACLANADLPVEEEQLSAAIAARGWGASVEVRNDTFAVLRAGLLEDAAPGASPSSAAPASTAPACSPTAAPPASPPSAASPATGAAEAASPRRPCGTRPARRTGGAHQQSWRAHCPSTSGWDRCTR